MTHDLKMFEDMQSYPDFLLGHLTDEDIEPAATKQIIHDGGSIREINALSMQDYGQRAAIVRHDDHEIAQTSISARRYSAPSCGCMPVPSGQSVITDHKAVDQYCEPQWIFNYC